MTLVAKVASMRDFSSSSMLEMMVWDGTGSFNVHYYIPEEDEQVCKTQLKATSSRTGRSCCNDASVHPLSYLYKSCTLRDSI